MPLCFPLTASRMSQRAVSFFFAVPRVLPPFKKIVFASVQAKTTIKQKLIQLSPPEQDIKPFGTGCLW